MEHSLKQQMLKFLWAGLATMHNSHMSTQWMTPPLRHPPFGHPLNHPPLNHLPLDQPLLDHPPLNLHQEARLHPPAVQVCTLLQVLITPFHTNCSSRHSHHRANHMHYCTLSSTADQCQNKFSFCSRLLPSLCSFVHPVYNFKRDCCCTCSSTCAESSPHC